MGTNEKLTQFTTGRADPMKGQRKKQDRLAAIDARVNAHKRRQKAIREDTRQQLAEAWSDRAVTAAMETITKEGTPMAEPTPRKVIRKFYVNQHEWDLGIAIGKHTGTPLAEELRDFITEHNAHHTDRNGNIKEARRG